MLRIIDCGIRRLLLKRNWKTLGIFLGIPWIVGIVSGLLSRRATEMFSSMEKAPLTPPGWVFPVVWALLFTLMGIASYLVYTEKGDREKKGDALFVYGLQLIVNFFWPIFFFNFRWFLFSFGWILVLWILILIMILRFSKINKTAAYLMLPYLIWVTFAAYLNLYYVL